MKKQMRTLCLILAVLMSAALFGGMDAAAAGGSIDMGDVVQLGDFDCPNLHIVFYPKELETSDRTWPVIVWANGTMCAPVLYTNLLKGLAAEGYVVVTNSDVMAANGKSQIAALDFILAQNGKAGSVFCGRIDASRIAAAGHSQGGRSTVNAAAADSRFGCVISIAGSPFTSEAKKLSAPTLFLTGTMDMIVMSSMWVRPAYKNCTGPAVYASLKNAVHTTCMLNPDAYIPYCVQWLHAWLDGDASALDTFRPGGALARDSAWKDYASKKI